MLRSLSDYGIIRWRCGNANDIRKNERLSLEGIYVGDKCFNFSELYIRLYVEKDEVVFSKSFPDEVDTSDASEFRMWWDEINRGLNQQGYWLFDEG